MCLVITPKLKSWYDSKLVNPSWKGKKTGCIWCFEVLVKRPLILYAGFLRPVNFKLNHFTQPNNSVVPCQIHMFLASDHKWVNSTFMLFIEEIWVRQCRISSRCLLYYLIEAAVQKYMSSPPTHPQFVGFRENVFNWRFQIMWLQINIH